MGKKTFNLVLRELSKQYGPLKAFKDEELFTEIEKLTTPEVGSFLERYVGGTEKLPYTEILGWAGISYSPENDQMVITAGKFTPGLYEKEEIYVADTDNLNDFGKDLDLRNGDILLVWNGKEITLETFSDVLDSYYSETEAGDKVTVMVRREVKGKNERGKAQSESKKGEIIAKTYAGRNRKSFTRTTKN